MCLMGTWIVRCRNGHDDRVDDITCNHDCDHCDDKSVTDGAANVVCPLGHVSIVGGVTTTHACPTCGRECRR